MSRNLGCIGGYIGCEFVAVAYAHWIGVLIIISVYIV